MTRDPRCGAHWQSTKWEHCTECHLTFTSTPAGDDHRIGEHGVDRRCRSVSEIAGRKRSNGALRWTVTPMAGDESHLLVKATADPAAMARLKARLADGAVEEEEW